MFRSQHCVGEWLLQLIRFFGKKVAELIGRLSAIQGDCATAEIHRRMCETYGEREGTRRMTNMVIQSQASWGTVERVEKGRRVIRLAPMTVDSDELTVWLIEAAVRYAEAYPRHQPAVAARALPVHPVPTANLCGIEQSEPMPPVGRAE